MYKNSKRNVQFSEIKESAQTHSLAKSKATFLKGNFFDCLLLLLNSIKIMLKLHFIIPS
jgi:hypothetical protein